MKKLLLFLAIAIFSTFDTVTTSKTPLNCYTPLGDYVDTCTCENPFFSKKEEKCILKCSCKRPHYYDNKKGKTIYPKPLSTSFKYTDAVLLENKNGKLKLDASRN